MGRLSLACLWLAAFAMVLSGCPKKQQKKRPSKREAAAVRGRADDAFADLNAEERGKPAPRPKAKKPEPKKEVKVEDLRPKPKPEPVVEKEIAKKPADSVPVNPVRAAPDWTLKQPQMPGYYIGIGVVSSRGNEGEDWDRARNDAYVELASSLKVHISSAIHDYFKENNMKLYKGDNVTKDVGRTDSSYAQDTSSFVDQTLEGVEIHDRWKNVETKQYWMFVKLSKAEIAKRIRERLEKARKKAVDYVKAAYKAEGQGRVAEAFKGYFKSYLALREHFGGVVEYDLDGDGKPEVLNHEIERAVHRLAGDTVWQVAQPNLNAINGSGLKEPLVVVVTYKGKPVDAFPVTMAFQRGKGSVESKVSTGADGQASAQVVKVFGEKKAIIGARLDVEALTDNKREHRIVEAKFGNSIDLKTGKFFITLEDLSAYINIDEEMLGEEVKVGSIATDVKDRLHAELGLVFTKSSRGADLEISGKAVVDSCTDFFNQRQCTARVNVTVTNRLKGKQLFAKKYKVKGNGENDKTAARAALGKVGKRIAKKIIQALK